MPDTPDTNSSGETWERRGLTIFRPREYALSIAVVTQHQKRAREYAALIAAAPDLLAALRVFRDFANSGAAFNYPPGSLQVLDAAIAKATTL